MGLLPFFRKNSISSNLVIKSIKNFGSQFFIFFLIKNILFGFAMPASWLIFDKSFSSASNKTIVWILIWLVNPAINLKGGSPLMISVLISFKLWEIFFSSKESIILKIFDCCSKNINSISLTVSKFLFVADK